MTSVLLVLWAALSMMPGKTLPLLLVHHSSPFALVTGYADPNHWHEGGDLFLRLGYLTGLARSRPWAQSPTAPRGGASPGSALGDRHCGCHRGSAAPHRDGRPGGYHVVDPTWPLQ